MEKRLVLIDPDDRSRTLLAARLVSLGFVVDVAEGAAAGAELALASPPAAVIADLWMRGISGVQLCRLLRAEPATVDVPIVLRAPNDDPRSRFWAEQAGAAGLVSKGRMGDLARVLRTVTARAPGGDGFFMHLAGDSFEIRDRIAHHLDVALFESVIAGEVRTLGSMCSFDKLFDAFSQLAARLMNYRWLAIATDHPKRFAIHAHPRGVASAEAEARATLEVDARAASFQIIDEDALESATEERVHVRQITFGSTVLGRIAISGPDVPFDHGLSDLVGLLGRELGGPIRMTTLVEQANRLATRDPLTDLMNRRAFSQAMTDEVARADRCGAPLSVLLLDIDHFKSINDRFGHPTGDAVIAALGAALSRSVRTCDPVARWGGEEFVVLLPNTNEDAAALVAMRIRQEIERASVEATNGVEVKFTTSVGVATRCASETHEAMLERADQAMYEAKTTGRNRVCVAKDPSVARLLKAG